MGVVGKNPSQRRRVSVKSGIATKIKNKKRAESSANDGKSVIPQSQAASSDISVPSPPQIAVYLAEMCAELMVMAKAANLPFVAHLLAMAQAEAEYAAERVSL